MERNRGGRPRHPDILTPAEWRVLEQLREGGTNAEIAVRLGISPDTVKYHIANMLAKLGVYDRRELAAWRPEPKRSRLPAVLTGPVALGSVVRPLVWVAIGGAALGAVAVVAVALLALAGNGDQPVAVAPPPTDSPGPSSSPTQAPPPAATPTPQPQATPTSTPVPTPQPTAAPAASPRDTPSPTPTPAAQSEAATFRYDAFGTDPPATIRAVLQPGLNLAGWTEPDASVALIFDAIPELTYVYAWDPDDQWFRWATRTDSGIVGDLKTLTPGMGLWLNVGGDGVVTWERPLIPQSGLAELREGWNLIVWAGDDGITTSEALKHLDGIVVAALDANGGRPATLTRGAAFWLKASSPRKWWQLTEPPTVEFVSYHSSVQQETLRGWLDDVVAYYARRFGHGVPGLVVRFGDDAVFGDKDNAPCGRYVRPVISLQTRCPEILAHEYAHAVQRYLAPAGSHGPVWLTEGVAERWFAQFAETGGEWTYAEHLEETVIPNAGSLADTLQTLETQGRIRGVLSYSVAELAADWLASQAGEEALYRYYVRHPTHATWEDAFQAVFGFTIADFYERFETYRAEVAAPAPLVEGIVLGPDGRPLEGIGVRFANVVGGNVDLLAKTDGDGRFDVTIREGGTTFALVVDQCVLRWSSSDTRIEPSRGGWGRFVLEAEGIEGLVLQLLATPSEQCGLIEGLITDLAGNPRQFGLLIASATSRSLEADDRLGVWTLWTVPRDGKFSLQVPRASYTLDVMTGSFVFGFHGGETGFTVRRGQATRLHLQDSDATDIAIPIGVIAGSLLGADGEPVQGVFVYGPVYQALSPTEIGAIPVGVPQTDSSGTFRVAFPKGTHTLEITCPWGDRGGWYGEHGFTTREEEATPIVLEAADVEDIVINVPFTQADVEAHTCPQRRRGKPRYLPNRGRCA